MGTSSLAQLLGPVSCALQQFVLGCGVLGAGGGRPPTKDVQEAACVPSTGYEPRGRGCGTRRGLLGRHQHVVSQAGAQHYRCCSLLKDSELFLLLLVFFSCFSLTQGSTDTSVTVTLVSIAV